VLKRIISGSFLIAGSLSLLVAGTRVDAPRGTIGEVLYLSVAAIICLGIGDRLREEKQGDKGTESESIRNED
jgi:hypothetical protein